MFENSLKFMKEKKEKDFDKFWAKRKIYPIQPASTSLQWQNTVSNDKIFTLITLIHTYYLFYRSKDIACIYS